MTAKQEDAPDAIAAGGAPSERIEELEFEHRIRLRGVARATLTLGFLRAAWRRWRAGTRSALARSVPRPEPGTIALTFVGHASVMLTTPGVRALTDPVLENSLHRLPRARSASIARGDLADVDLALITSAEPDHLSLTTLSRLPSKVTLVVPRHCGDLVGHLAVSRVVELAAGRSLTFGDMEVNAVPAHRLGARARGGGKNRRGACGYVVQSQGRTIYCSGDTGYFSGFSEIGRRFQPDVAVLPIAGYEPAPFRKEHLSPLDAVYALEDLGARTLIPVAFGSFLLSYEPMDQPLAWLRRITRDRALESRVTLLEHGQTCLVR